MNAGAPHDSGAARARFTDVFVRRPVLSLVFSLLILLVGLRALMSLPVRQYPALESATISVATDYPGASQELMQGFVTTPIAQSIATADGIEYITSTTTQGKSVVKARLRLNANADRAMTEVMAKVQQVKYKLPADAYDSVITKLTDAPTAVMYLGFASDALSIAQITDYVVRVAQPLVTTVPGVASAEILGGQNLAMRVWLDATRLAAHGLSAGDVAAAIRANNVQAAAGQVKGSLTIADISANTDLTDVGAFNEMVVKSAPNGGGLVRLKDVATVEIGGENYNSSALMNGRRAVYIAVNATPAGNPLEIVRGVGAVLPAMERNKPASVQIANMFDGARFVNASIAEVRSTLTEAIAIVVVVIFLFLGSFRAVIIPVLTIPLSLVGSAALMLAAGFSLNLLTLLAMVLAIGLVVDDAIVVVENIHRHIEQGEPPVRAALIGAREIASPVLVMMATLISVYAPIGLMGGLTGLLFKEFAFTLAGAVLVSGIVALTLSPMLGSLLLTSRMSEGRVAKAIERTLERVTHAYRRGLHASLAARPAILLIGAGVLAGIVLLFSGVKRELAPQEDQGSIMVAVKAPQYANLDYMERYAPDIERVFRTLPEADTSFILNSYGGSNLGFAGVNLVDWDKRTRSAAALQALIQARGDGIRGERVFAFQLPALPASSGGLPIQMVLRTPSGFADLYAQMERIKAAAQKSGLFAVLDSDLTFDSRAVGVTIDRNQANTLGVTMKDIADTLAVLVGENYVNRFNFKGRSYDVIPQVSRSERLSSEMLSRYYVKTGSGQMIPLSTVIQVTNGSQANALSQFNQMNAATFSAVPAPGVTMGDAVAFLEAQKLPAGFSIDWLGESRQYVQEGNRLAVTFGFALIVIFLVLAAQFESLRDPLVILVSVPLSICGALAPLYLGFATLNIYTQIGLVTLIGLISKHGILMVSFANDLQRHEGLDRRAAIERAAAVRLRPILMTTAAMVAGLVPLVFAAGAGAASRFAIGITVSTGMLVGTLFTLFVLPTVYTFVAKDHGAAMRSERAQLLAATR
ncbi:efflux RND transporter permease subunit [Burkholderia pseudomallei]|uniref:efflux RND transporter permease subunit n=1 Tax=Burkholderia pseudomallei TaxID=28450 RepID=UPI000F0700FB|nr:efflux RND transporter permease subunit [Burkholderia pseudomallei]CAJ5897108.1 hydrophobe/amphiphile efflux family protein [Burkholderia pseudomallei]VBJ84576.1 hydrophobe/amphiphile efflux family protein [Burkholderia pseudomallei]VBL21065.1 hydrophobe/amphiphile efflux family protein [Burkholderia pseudomallei]VBT89886.1 hydrophobe/amphiphile efflux family protein [Burkholderia pseudomallei]VCM10706.1 hydrophobe/amphiphile efflux family protein [Burkholderia pseudomallei]